MTVRNVDTIRSLDGFSLGASDGDDKIVLGKIEMAEINLAQRAKKTAQFGGEFLKPASAHIGIFESIPFGLYFEV